ncbi:MAG: M28 family peptidase [Candidatus Marinimicrobia bacterium]|nr:M28 family peptidase [Candidatus Neomarinimicrobiota bacterium]
MIQDIYKELARFPKRLKRKDKTLFLDFIVNKMESLGYAMKTTNGRYYFNCVNLETEKDDCEVVLGAHYDTPTILPFYFEYLFRLIGHTRQFLLLLMLFTILAAGSFFLKNYEYLDWLLRAFQWTFYISFLSLLIPNPVNQNDNTSGVATLLDIAEKISGNPDLKSKIKFIFFDNEELGLLGSFMQRKKWKKENFFLTDKKIITVDCVAHGEVPVIVYHKNAELAHQLSNTFFSQNIKSKVLRLPFYPISDNYPFSETGAVNISMMNRTVVPGGYYIKNVHNPRDNQVDFNIINLISNTLIRFIESRDQVINEAPSV